MYIYIVQRGETKPISRLEPRKRNEEKKKKNFIPIITTVRYTDYLCPTHIIPMNPPRRLLFIASIGNLQAPYRTTRHSAGHLLLDALSPLLPTHLPASFYHAWYSPAYMNVSGPNLVRQLQKWLSTHHHQNEGKATTLVILHDELEAPLGRIRVKRGGPEQGSLRGHRGLISVFETLRKKGLYYPSSSPSSSDVDLSVLRVGVGIGRPPTRDRDAVKDYVLSEMKPAELTAVHRGAAPVVKLLLEELYRESPISS